MPRTGLRQPVDPPGWSWMRACGGSSTRPRDRELKSPRR
jgi:hypothetical protein